MRVVDDPGYRQNARQLQIAIEALPGIDYAVDLIEQLAEESNPHAKAETSRTLVSDLLLLWLDPRIRMQ